MKKQLTAKEAKDLLEPIPNTKFITDIFTDGEGKCCAIGHLQRLASGNPNNYNFNNCSDLLSDNTGIRDLSARFIGIHHKEDGSIATVNNTKEINGYTERSIKDRVMHLLDDMIAHGL